MEELTRGGFTQVGKQGLGDPRNSYPHSVAWFRDRLFLGTTRDSLCLMKRPNRPIPLPKLDCWPVNCADPEIPERMRAEVRCFDPTRGDWGLAYKSPLIELDGKQVQRDVGYRGMVVFQGKSDSEPVLYVGSVSATGSKILRSVDGEVFETTGTLPGPSVRDFGVFRGKLYTSIVGQTGRHGNESSHREVWESEDPASGRWIPVSEPGFGDPENVSLFYFEAFNGFLYATTMNPTGGFQLWKTDGEGRPPYRWHKVLSAGAYRGFLNEFGLSMCVFGDHLYVGSGIAGGGYDRVRKVGPAPAELIRVHADDSWDLVMGAPRLTPDGLKVPLSGLGPGFDNVMNGYLWFQCVHDDVLYASTFCAAAFSRYRPHQLPQSDPEKMEMFRKLIPTRNMEEYAERYGGCHLWCSHDGEHFEPVERNGFGTQYNMGIRQMISTPVGLFACTANPFGPEVAVKENDEWRYVHNPRGGIEVWLGATPEPVRAVTRSGSEERDERYRHALLRTGTQIEAVLHAIMLEELYGRPGYSHIGYWKHDPATAAAACDALVDRLVELLGTVDEGMLLDVGCGKGATTERLAGLLPQAQVLGVDHSLWALDHARLRAPGLRFELMDATRLQLEQASVAHVLCAEGAPTFITRRRFLSEAARVLRPGGSLVMADVLYGKQAVAANRGRYRFNYVKDLESYARLFGQAGFEPDVFIEEATEHTVGPYMDHFGARLKELYGSRRISGGHYNSAMAILSRQGLFVRDYVFVAARVAPR